jgi:hypothetical protein
VTEINEAWMQCPCAALMNYALNAAVLHTALRSPNVAATPRAPNMTDSNMRLYRYTLLYSLSLCAAMHFVVPRSADNSCLRNRYLPRGFQDTAAACTYIDSDASDESAQRVVRTAGRAAGLGQ